MARRPVERRTLGQVFAGKSRWPSGPVRDHAEGLTVAATNYTVSDAVRSRWPHPKPTAHCQRVHHVALRIDAQRDATGAGRPPRGRPKPRLRERLSDRQGVGDLDEGDRRERPGPLIKDDPQPECRNLKAGLLPRPSTLWWASVTLSTLMPQEKDPLAAGAARRSRDSRIRR
jgi:hypothetical protein